MNCQWATLVTNVRSKCADIVKDWLGLWSLREGQAADDGLVSWLGAGLNVESLNMGSIMILISTMDISTDCYGVRLPGLSRVQFVQYVTHTTPPTTPWLKPAIDRTKSVEIKIVITYRRRECITKAQGSWIWAMLQFIAGLLAPSVRGDLGHVETLFFFFASTPRSP